ncbi:MAG TPA: metallophosphoesterase [Leptospiraceae bacterium]|nr:metallophosphoesterase [Leptospirales bacterium]HMU83522.1 metallophosphoesterase [Leptospiraceae bacterium]HMW59223.1 metallophosphoesterase [Leptospiraceae bacterium]HMX55171.1 metallophosphoesterase [Leptospiraceae bacterium]HMZ36321.1 metallophosphoesterase [Leptospiraceae bacterium]
MKLWDTINKPITRKAFLATFAGAFYTAAVERYWIAVNEYNISFPRLPRQFDGFRIGFLSDIHLGLFMPGAWVDAIVDRANALGVDALVLGGDYVHARKTDHELLLVWSKLKKLSAPSGVFAVNGNHDHWANHDLPLRLLDSSGFSVRHKVATVKRGRATIAIAGVGDLWEDEFLLDETLKDIPDSVFRIVLAHNPDSADLPHTSRVDLFLSGHTHGGQVRIPFLNWSPVIPVKNKAYDLGLKQNTAEEKIFISKGLGWAILPIRFNVRPEIAIITLRSAEP